jgi:hypothetical protein
MKSASRFLSPEFLVVVVGGLLLVSGLVLILLSLRHQRPGDGVRPSFDPRKWKPVWMQGYHFCSATGFSYYVLGFDMLGAGILINAVYFILE